MRAIGLESPSSSFECIIDVGMVSAYRLRDNVSLGITEGTDSSIFLPVAGRRGIIKWAGKLTSDKLEGLGHKLLGVLVLVRHVGGGLDWRSWGEGRGRSGDGA